MIVLSALSAPEGCFSQNNGGQREGLLEVKFSASDKVVEESHEAASENNTCMIATLEEVYEPRSGSDLEITMTMKACCDL